MAKKVTKRATKKVAKKSRLGRGLRSLIETPVSIEPLESDNIRPEPGESDGVDGSGGDGSSGERRALGEADAAGSDASGAGSGEERSASGAGRVDAADRSGAGGGGPAGQSAGQSAPGGGEGWGLETDVSSGGADRVPSDEGRGGGSGGFWSRVAIGTSGVEARSLPRASSSARVEASAATLGAGVRDGGADGGAGGLTWVEVDRVRASAWQPRETFDEARLGELAESIRRSGLIQPIVVRPIGDGFELVAGERRVRAAAMAGLDRVPAVVRDLSDHDAAEWALMENIQREDLNPVERARAMRRLVDTFAITQAEVADRVGLDRSTVTNHLRLLDLEDEILDLVAGGKLGMGHGRALAGLARVSLRLELARQAAKEGWSVRRLERAVAEPERERLKAMGGEQEGPIDVEVTVRQAAVAEWEKKLGERLGTRVGVRTNKTGQKGKLVVEFYSLEHFEDLVRRMGAG